MKRKILCIVLCLWAIAGIQYVMKQNVKNEEKIIEAFNNTNFVEADSSVEVLARVTEEYMEPSAQEQMLKELVKSAGVEDDIQITTKNSDNIIQKVWSGENDDRSISMKFVTIQQEKGNHEIDTEQYLYMQLHLKNDFDYALSYKDKIEETMKDYPAEAKVSMNLSGTYAGMLSLEEKNRIADRIISTTRAKVVSECREENSFNIYGYTSVIDEYQTVQGQKINLNVVLTYDETEDKTILYVSTPFMNQDY